MPDWCLSHRTVQRRLNRIPNRRRRFGQRNLRSEPRGKLNLLQLPTAPLATRQMLADPIHIVGRKHPIVIRRELIGNMKSKHHREFLAPADARSDASFSASILCPQLSRDATVPTEQFSACAIWAYDRS